MGFDAPRELARIAAHEGQIVTLCWSPNGKSLATAGADHTIKLWDLSTRRELATLSGHTDAVRCVAFSPDGQALASGCDDGVLKLWDMHTSQELLSLDAHAGGVKTVAFSADGKRLATGGVPERARGRSSFGPELLITVALERRDRKRS